MATSCDVIAASVNSPEGVKRKRTFPSQTLVMVPLSSVVILCALWDCFNNVRRFCIVLETAMYCCKSCRCCFLGLQKSVWLEMFYKVIVFSLIELICCMWKVKGWVMAVSIFLPQFVWNQCSSALKTSKLPASRMSWQRCCD